MTLSKSVSKRLKAQSSAPAFRDVYAAWFKDGCERNLNPFRPATAKSYKSQIETNVLPVIGDLPVDTVGNIVLKDLASKMKANGLAPATIHRNLNNIKDIRKFPNDGEKSLYPYDWNSRIIDAPAIDKKAQKRPIASAQAVQAALSCLCGTQGTKLLLAVLAGSGMRIQEALAIVKVDPAIGDGVVGNVWLPEKSKILVNAQRDGAAFGPTKTPAGMREVDLHPRLNALMLSEFDGTGYIFNRPESTYRDDLIRCGITGGFHSLRRFRVTHLRMQGIPDSLIHFWVGHEDASVTGRYTEVGIEIEKRKKLAEQAGLGFEL
ncbi:Phage integrase family protein [uncultured archaeon]|nr:Phage integrase family protein [uncultured archaeon]